MTNIFKWSWSSPKGQASFTFLKGVDSQWAIDIAAGRPLRAPFPSDAYFEMNPERPKDVKLGEQHSNLEDMIVIGPRLSEFVRSLGTASIELLPVQVHDHKGRVASREYNIVHTAHVVDCLDTAASGAKWNPINREQMMSWGTLTLRDGDYEFSKIFRIRHVPGVIFVTDEVAQAIQALGFKEPYLKALSSV